MQINDGPPVRAANILPPDTVTVRGAGGVVYARSPHALGAYPATLTERLDQWAERAPDRTFLAERGANGEWRRVSYAAALSDVRAVAQALLNRGLGAGRPLLILSGNGVDHATLALAAMYVGVPYAPVAPSYSLRSKDHRALKAIYASMQPALVFVADESDFERALRALPLDDVEIVARRPAERATRFDTLCETSVSAGVDDAHRLIGPDTIAKILYTSGSTGTPKGVINTQRMLSANQEQLRTVLPFLGDEPPVLCDWLPWNHTFGGNHNFGLTLYNGGTLYIDAGTPTSSGFATTLTNLHDVETSAYFNVPRGFEMLLPALRGDTAFRDRFFRNLKMLFYAAAGLRQEVADAIEGLAIESCGERIPWVTGLGATESAPFAICTGAMPVPVAGRIGVPVPGVELKVAPVGPRLEARVRGPNITPGYWRDPDLTRASFDEEGFFRMGDAVRFVDPTDPSRGFTFDGRIAEDFKLSTGTWVRVGPLRRALLSHLGDLAEDVVMAGEGRHQVALLVFPNLAACAQLCGAAPGSAARSVLSHARVLETFGEALATFSVDWPSSSTVVQRAVLLEDPPSLDAGEITDKGSLNQRAVLAHRASLVAGLYELERSAGSAIVIDISGAPRLPAAGAGK